MAYYVGWATESFGFWLPLIREIREIRCFLKKKNLRL